MILLAPLLSQRRKELIYQLFADIIFRCKKRCILVVADKPNLSKYQKLIEKVLN